MGQVQGAMGLGIGSIRSTKSSEPPSRPTKSVKSWPKPSEQQAKRLWCFILLGFRQSLNGCMR